jgi:hypothetical protein
MVSRLILNPHRSADEGDLRNNGPINKTCFTTDLPTTGVMESQGYELHGRSTNCIRTELRSRVNEVELS